jgi:hypothetical protein
MREIITMGLRKVAGWYRAEAVRITAVATGGAALAVLLID